jgi:hypothetical protein
MFLCAGGETVFFGPLGVHSCNLIDYLQSIPGTPPISEGENPATWMLGGCLAGVVMIVMMMMMMMMIIMMSSSLARPAWGENPATWMLGGCLAEEREYIMMRRGRRMVVVVVVMMFDDDHDHDLTTHHDDARAECIGAGTGGSEKCDYAAEYKQSALDSLCRDELRKLIPSSPALDSM